MCILTFSSNFDDHEYENFDPRECSIPGIKLSAANQPLHMPGTATTIPSQQVEISEPLNVREGRGLVSSSVSGVCTQNSSFRAGTSSNVGVAMMAEPVAALPLGLRNDEAQQPFMSPILNKRGKLLESQIGETLPQSPRSSQRNKNGNAPPPPVRKSSTLTRSNHSSSSPVQELEGRPRKTSLPSSPNLELKSNNTVQRSKSIRLQAARLQDMLSGKSTQDDADDEAHSTCRVKIAATLADQESQNSGADSASLLIKPLAKPSVLTPPVPVDKSKDLQQPHEMQGVAMAAPQIRIGNVSQGSLDDESKSRLDQIRQKLSTEIVYRTMASGLEESKTGAGTQVDPDASEYKPRLQMIKAKVEKRRREAAQGNTMFHQTKSVEADDSSATSTFDTGVNPSLKRPGDVSPILEPPPVPLKPHPGQRFRDGTTKNVEDKSAPLLPLLKPEESGDLMDDEEPPPLPARTPAMFELEKTSPKKMVRPHYTNVSLSSESIPAASPPAACIDKNDMEKKDTSKKKVSNYPRVLLKKFSKKEKTPEPSVNKTKGKDRLSPTVSPTKMTEGSPTKKEQSILVRAKTESGSSKSRPTSGPVARVHPPIVRPPMFINMRERPLPQIPNEFGGDYEEPPDHTAEDYEQFELGRGIPLYANSDIDQPLPGRSAVSVQRAHSFNPGDRHRFHDPSRSNSPGHLSFDRSNFDPLPIPPLSQRPTSNRPSSPDYVDGYVNTLPVNQLPTRGGPLQDVLSGMREQQHALEGEHSDYDYPDLHQRGFLAHTLPSRRKPASPFVRPGIASKQWGNDGYPSLQQWSNPPQSIDLEGAEMRDRLDSDYVPMSSVFTMDDSYINWETVKDINSQTGITNQSQQLQQQRVAPPREGDPPLSYAVDDMYVNVPHGTSSTNRVLSQDERLRKIQQLLPARGFSPSTSASTQQQFIASPLSHSVSSLAETGQEAFGTLPSPRLKAKARQRSATAAGALEGALPMASVVPGSPHPSFHEQAWRLPPAVQPLKSQLAARQAETDSSLYHNIDPSSSLPASLSPLLREEFDRRSSDGNVLAVKPSTAALPPRNIPRRPQH